MGLLDEQLLVLDDEQRPAAAARVSGDPQLLVLDVAHDAHLGADVHAPPQRAQSWRGVRRET